MKPDSTDRWERKPKSQKGSDVRSGTWNQILNWAVNFEQIGDGWEHNNIILLICIIPNIGNGEDAYEYNLDRRERADILKWF